MGDQIRLDTAQEMMQGVVSSLIEFFAVWLLKLDQISMTVLVSGVPGNYILFVEFLASIRCDS
jgi:hypothetical protein